MKLQVNSAASGFLLAHRWSVLLDWIIQEDKEEWIDFFAHFFSDFLPYYVQPLSVL